MAERLDYEDIPYYKKQFDDLIKCLRVKIDTVGETVKQEFSDTEFYDYTPDSLLFSPISNRHDRQHSDRQEVLRPRTSTDVKPLKRSNPETIQGSNSLYTSKEQPSGVPSGQVVYHNKEAGPHEPYRYENRTKDEDSLHHISTHIFRGILADRLI